MANEKVIVAPGGPNDSNQDHTVSLLTAGTETVADTVGTDDIAIILGSAVDIENSGEVEEQIKKLVAHWREFGFATTLP